MFDKRKIYTGLGGVYEAVVLFPVAFPIRYSQHTRPPLSSTLHLASLLSHWLWGHVKLSRESVFTRTATSWDQSLSCRAPILTLKTDFLLIPPQSSVRVIQAPSPNCYLQFCFYQKKKNPLSNELNVTLLP